MPRLCPPDPSGCVGSSSLAIRASQAVAGCAKLKAMSCPLCGQRPARRRCPALSRDICPVCCGTKRLVEVSCPPDCGYLRSARAHPPATVRRQQERDLGFVMAMHEGLTQPQSELFWALLTFTAGFRGDPLLKVVDEDLADGAGALAATYETAGRGVIYEHRPQSLVAQRFVTDLRAFLGSLSGGSPATARRIERDAPVLLRRLEAGARNVRKTVDEGPATALDIISRVVATAAREAPARADSPAAEPPRPTIVTP